MSVEAPETPSNPQAAGQQLTPEQVAQMFPDLQDPGGAPIPRAPFEGADGGSAEPPSYPDGELPELTAAERVALYGNDGTDGSAALGGRDGTAGPLAPASGPPTPYWLRPGRQPLPDRNPVTKPLPAVRSGRPKAPDIRSGSADSHDTEVAYTDRELLGKSHRVKVAIEDRAVKRVTRWERIKAKVGNALDRPGEKRLQRRVDRAQDALNARKAHQNIAKSALIRDRRQGAVTSAEGKVTDRKAALQARRDRIVGRTKTADKNIEARKRARNGTIEGLKKQSAEAKARKALRQELRNDSAGRREAKKIVNEKISAGNLQRVGTLILTAEASRRRLSGAEYHEQVAAGRVRATLSGIAESQKSIALLERESAEAPGRINDIGGRLDTIGREAAALGSQLDALHPPGPEDDADYASRYADLRSQFERVQMEQQGFRNDLAHQRDIVTNNPERLTRVNGRLTRLQTEALPAHQQQAEAASRSADAFRGWDKEHQNDRDVAIHDTLYADKKTKRRRSI